MCDKFFSHALDKIDGHWLCGGCSHLYDDTMGDDYDGQTGANIDDPHIKALVATVVLRVLDVVEMK